MKSEQNACQQMNQQLELAGGIVQGYRQIKISAAMGVVPAGRSETADNTAYFC